MMPQSRTETAQELLRRREERRMAVIEALTIFLEATARIEKAKALLPIQNRLKKDMQTIFTKQERIFISWMERYRHRFEEALGSEDLDAIMASVEIGTAVELGRAIETAGGSAIMAATGQRAAETGIDIAFDLTNPRAVGWLSENAALKVTQINETTRARIATIVARGTEEGWAYNKTAKEIKDRFEEFRIGKPQLHIQSRAHLVAVTESANAYEAGNKMVIDEMTAIGLEMEKKWMDSGDDLVSDECEANSADGWIPADQPHSSGHMHPPRFPGCRCDELWRRRKR